MPGRTMRLCAALTAAFLAGCGDATAPASLQRIESLLGVWGGRGIELQVSAGSSHLAFGCYVGPLDTPAPDPDGRFVTTGWFGQDWSEHHSVRGQVTGRVVGSTLALRVELEGVPFVEDYVLRPGPGDLDAFCPTGRSAGS